MMIKLWDIKLYQKKKGKYKCIIINEEGKKTEGIGRTAHLAYEIAVDKHIFKPWLESRG